MTTSRRTSTLPPSDAYSDLEIQKLSEFREKVGDILLTEDQKDDSFLIRWLRARNLDVTKAEEMLRSSLQWRQENDIDTILEGGDDVPEDLRERAPIAYCGISGEGYAVFVIPFGRHDLRYGLEKYGSEVMERCDTRNMEMLLKLMRDEGARRGRRVTQMIEIADSEGLVVEFLNGFGSLSGFGFLSGSGSDSDRAFCIRTLSGSDTDHAFSIRFLSGSDSDLPSDHPKTRFKIEI